MQKKKQAAVNSSKIIQCFEHRQKQAIQVKC